MLFSSCVFQSFWNCDCLALVRGGGKGRGERAADLDVFRSFVRFVLVWFCLFPLPVSGKGCGL